MEPSLRSYFSNILSFIYLLLFFSLWGIKKGNFSAEKPVVRVKIRILSGLILLKLFRGSPKCSFMLRLCVTSYIRFCFFLVLFSTFKTISTCKKIALLKIQIYLLSRTWCFNKDFLDCSWLETEICQRDYICKSLFYFTALQDIFKEVLCLRNQTNRIIVRTLN